MSYLVIKCGGSMLNDLPQKFYENIVTLQQKYQLKPIIVHGGGPLISSLLTDLKIETKFVDGMRITTEAVLDVAEMVLSGTVNKQLVRDLQLNDGKSVGISGVDGNLLEGEPLATTHELGFVGCVRSVNTDLLDELTEKGYIPVVAPMATDNEGQRWNINADLTAAAIAEALNAPFYMVTNVDGVLKDHHVVSQLTPKLVNRFIADGVINGGMIPKVTAATDCLRTGVERVVIFNGMEPDNLLKLANGEHVGTSFVENVKQSVI